MVEGSLLSMEELGRSSPELWPELSISEYMGVTNLYKKVQPWMKVCDSDDIALMIYLSKLTPAGLVAEVKKLYNTVYQLGCEESKEMTRGKYLRILTKKPNS